MPYLTELNMRVTTCTCGITWAAPEEWFVSRQKDHKTFFCPNGCHRYFPQENEVEKLRARVEQDKREAEKLRRRLEQEQKCCIRATEEANQLEKSRRAYKGMVTKLKKKAQED